MISKRSLLAAAVAVVATVPLLLGAGPVGAATHRPNVAAKLTYRSITLGSSTSVVGRVQPRQAGHRIFLQRSSGGHWHSVASHRLGKYSRYTFHVRPATAGVKHYRVYDPRTRSGRPRAFSHSLTLTVRHRSTSSVSHTSCTSGYSPCIAPGADVDCAGGSGDGPRYVQGPVKVSGSDPYDLDRDGDGVACES
jgi:hypothetical protein